MTTDSAIEWTTHTWNPWMGCHKVSQGCKNCYMYREQKQYGRDPNVVVRSKTKFNEPLKWKEPARVFTCSWSDWFIEEADEWREEAWEIIRRTPHLTYQILTKRPENIPGRLPRHWAVEYKNVWLGISIEDQDSADRRIPLLFDVPAYTRFYSCEPLLGLVDLYMPNYVPDWVIIGGESGPNYRPMELGWAIHIINQCDGIPVFVKQLGGWPDKRGDISKFPTPLQIREYP